MEMDQEQCEKILDQNCKILIQQQQESVKQVVETGQVKKGQMDFKVEIHKKQNQSQQDDGISWDYDDEYFQEDQTQKMFIKLESSDEEHKSRVKEEYAHGGEERAVYPMKKLKYEEDIQGISSDYYASSKPVRKRILKLEYIIEESDDSHSQCPKKYMAQKSKRQKRTSEIHQLLDEPVVKQQFGVLQKSLKRLESLLSQYQSRRQ